MENNQFGPCEEKGVIDRCVQNVQKRLVRLEVKRLDIMSLEVSHQFHFKDKLRDISQVNSVLEHSFRQLAKSFPIKAVDGPGESEMCGGPQVSGKHAVTQTGGADGPL